MDRVGRYRKWLAFLFAGLFLVFLICAGSLWFLANGRVDPYYLRFTTPVQKSMILGTSRSAQGLQPSVFNGEGPLSFEGPMYNFSFTGTHSPWGEAYLRVIRMKLDASAKNGIFILEVNPRSISYRFQNNPSENPELFHEKGTVLDKISSVTQKPNFEFFEKFYEDYYYNIFLRNIVPQDVVLQKDGWVRITCRMDEFNVNRRKSKTVRTVRDEFASAYKYSPKRYEALREAIELLKQHGHVYLVRLPVSVEVRGLEENYMGDFDEKIASIAAETGARYLNLIDLSDTMRTTDGHHLYKDDGLKVTQILYDKIAEDLAR